MSVEPCGHLLVAVQVWAGMFGINSAAAAKGTGSVQAVQQGTRKLAGAVEEACTSVGAALQRHRCAAGDAANANCLGIDSKDVELLRTATGDQLGLQTKALLAHQRGLTKGFASKLELFQRVAHRSLASVTS